ncbi:MAG: hypothetical protein FWB72_02740 [Firmicutes bacterium]|nr:hypothetical protein [Bacillota bacterium]
MGKNKGLVLPSGGEEMSKEEASNIDGGLFWKAPLVVMGFKALGGVAGIAKKTEGVRTGIGSLISGGETLRNGGTIGEAFASAGASAVTSIGLGSAGGAAVAAVASASQGDSLAGIAVNTARGALFQSYTDV